MAYLAPDSKSMKMYDKALGNNSRDGVSPRRASSRAGFQQIANSSTTPYISQGMSITSLYTRMSSQDEPKFSSNGGYTSSQPTNMSSSIMYKNREIILSATEGLQNTKDSKQKHNMFSQSRLEEFISSSAAALQNSKQLQGVYGRSSTQSSSNLVSNQRLSSARTKSQLALYDSVLSGSKNASQKKTSVSSDRQASLSQNAICDSIAPYEPLSNSPANTSKKDVVIHVFDEAKNVKRDFFCKRTLLLREMKYFCAYLNEKTPTMTDNYVHIDVHCDVEVFEWLINYISKHESAIEVKRAVSILISSHFLQMPNLEETCIKFIHDHINQVIEVPIDLKCIHKDLVRKISALFTIDELSKIEDPRDKIKSQFYMCKISEMLENSDGNDSSCILDSCVKCSKVYKRSMQQSLFCEKSGIEIDFNGDIASYHERNKYFDVNEYIVAMFISGKSWEKVYWRVWGLLNYMKCTVCKRIFSCVDYVTCRKHIVPAKYLPNAEHGNGHYSCCNETSLKFAPFELHRGCRFFNHVPDGIDHFKNGSEVVEDESVYETFQKHIELVLWTKWSVNDMTPVSASSTVRVGSPNGNHEEETVDKQAIESAYFKPWKQVHDKQDGDSDIQTPGQQQHKGSNGSPSRAVSRPSTGKSTSNNSNHMNSINGPYFNSTGSSGKKTLALPCGKRHYALRDEDMERMDNLKDELLKLRVM